MSLFRSLIKKFWSKTDEDSTNFNTSQGILIKPDGTWSMSPSANKKPPVNPPNIIKMPPAQNFVPGKDYLYYDQDPIIEELAFPPDYFPHAKELYGKLEKCLELEVVSSCAHKQTRNNVYILRVELPCRDVPGICSHIDNMKRFKTFVKAMEETYKLTAIQQERINSTTCADKYYLVIFEYDPRKFYINSKMKKETE
jgi:hypothetical protein